MAIFEITSPDGKKFRVTAPEGATREQALAKVRAEQDASPSTDFSSTEERAPRPDNQPWDVPLTGAQMRAGQEQTHKADAALGEPTEPGFKHLLWSLIAEPLKLGQTATGQRPLPKGAEGLGMAASIPLASPVGRGAIAAANKLIPPPPHDLPPFPTGGMSREQASEIASQVGVSKRAGEQVAKRLSQDLKAEGKTPLEAAEELEKARALGKPMGIADIGGGNIQGLTGAVYRQPGESKGIIKQFFEGRDRGSGDRARSDVARDLGTGPSARRTTQGLQQHQVQEAQPLYDKAFEGGSIAPLKTQFEQAFDAASVAASEAAQDLAYAEKGQVHGDLGSQRLVQAARQKWERANQDKQIIMERAQAAQEDIANNVPGAVWNPRIQQFLDDPISKGGLRRGIEIQRLEALAKGERFDPTEYAIVGTDEAGNPIVGKVPNMRTLDAVKKGMDAIIQDSRGDDGRLNQYGRAVDQVRRALLDELDNVNLDYKAARSSWQGNAASMDAVRLGRNIHRISPEEVADAVAGMGESDKEFLRLGVADNMLERVSRTSFGGDEAKALIKNEWAKGQLRPVFRSEADFQRYVDSVAYERLMFETKRLVMGNSQTAERHAEDFGHAISAGAHAAHGVGHALSGSLLPAAISAVRTARFLGLRPNPKLNAEIARLLTDTGALPMTTPNAGLTVSRFAPRNTLDQLGGP